MANLALKGISVDELSFKLNGIRIQRGDKVEINPAFSRRVRRVAENGKIFFVTLGVKIENTAEKPKPFDLHVTMTGAFEAESEEDEVMRAAVIEGTSVLYPYLRAAVTSLTSTALSAPIVLPIVSGPLFPEDAPKEGQFS